MKVFGTWLRIAGTTIALLAAVWLLAQTCFHLKLLAVQTGSMRPTFKPGDALIVRQENLNNVHVGQVVSYHSARNANELVTHRVVAVSKDSFQTKGDRLNTPDPAVRDRLLAGRVVMILPGLGTLLGWFRTVPGLIICVYVPAVLMAVRELRRLEQYYKRFRIYRLRTQTVL